MSADGDRGPGILRLTLKKKWFDMIASGEKKEEYRKPGKWIYSRLDGRRYDRVEFKNGYGTDVPTCEVEYLDYYHGAGKEEWGSCMELVVIIRLGRVLSVKNTKHLQHD